MIKSIFRLVLRIDWLPVQMHFSTIAVFFSQQMPLQYFVACSRAFCLPHSWLYLYRALTDSRRKTAACFAAPILTNSELSPRDLLDSGCILRCLKLSQILQLACRCHGMFVVFGHIVLPDVQLRQDALNYTPKSPSKMLI